MLFYPIKKRGIYLAELVVHPLPPLIDAQCRVLILGTMCPLQAQCIYYKREILTIQAKTAKTSK